MRGKGCIFALSLLFLISSCGKKGPPTPKVLTPSYAINDLRGEVKDGVLFLSFSIPKGELKDEEVEGFEVEKKDEKGKVERKYVSMEKKGLFTLYKDRIYFFDDQLSVGHTYTYRVLLYLKGGKLFGSSNPFSIKWIDPPGLVSEVETISDGRTVELRWLGEKGYLYNVYRYEKGSYALFPLNEKPLETPFFRDAYILKEGTYIYEVRKIRKEGDLILEGMGKPLEVVFKRKVTLPVPRNVKAEKDESAIKIRWEIEKKEGVRGVVVYRKSSLGTERLCEIPVDQKLYVDLSYPKERHLIYFLRSVSEEGEESEESNNVIVHLKED